MQTRTFDFRVIRRGALSIEIMLNWRCISGADGSTRYYIRFEEVQS